MKLKALLVSLSLSGLACAAGAAAAPAKAAPAPKAAPKNPAKLGDAGVVSQKIEAEGPHNTGTVGPKTEARADAGVAAPKLETKADAKTEVKPAEARTDAGVAAPKAEVKAAAAGAKYTLVAIPAPDKATERSWKSKCGTCHGADGKAATEKGKKMKMESMASAAWQTGHSDAELKNVILKGLKETEDGVKKEMDGYESELKPEQVEALLKYVRYLGAPR